MRCFFYFSLGAKGKSLKISSFKCAFQNDKSGGRASGSKPLKNSARICYVPQESERTLTESQEVTSEADETTPGSRAIQNLFRHWLTLLRTPSPNQAVDEAIEGPSTREISETQNVTQINKRGEIPRAVWGYFVALDATIKIPLMIFIPLYLAVNVIYGAEVSKELIPFWIIGPLLLALHIKTLRWLSAISVFSFKQTVRVAKKLPVAFNYIARGNLKEDIRAHFRQPLVEIKNSDYKELQRVLKVWLQERSLDLVEYLWPSYCSTVRSLKKANLM
ncbi:hypothetical protein LguiB_022758 [Lonicera macranthoides]